MNNEHDLLKSIRLQALKNRQLEDEFCIERIGATLRFCILNEQNRLYFETKDPESTINHFEFFSRVITHINNHSINELFNSDIDEVVYSELESYLKEILIHSDIEKLWNFYNKIVDTYNKTSEKINELGDKLNNLIPEQDKLHILAYGSGKPEKNQTIYKTLYDFLSKREQLNWLFDEFIEPRFVRPILDRLDDLMNMSVRVMDKNLPDYYEKYWNRRIEIERNKQTGKTNQPSNPSTNEYKTSERAGEIDFTNLTRAVTMASDLLADMYKESQILSPQEDLQRVGHDYETNPDYLKIKNKEEKDTSTIHLYTPDEIKKRLETSESSLDDFISKYSMESYDKELTEEVEKEVIMFDKPVLKEVNIHEYTIFGDKKITSWISEEEMGRKKEENIKKMVEEKSPYIFNSVQDHAFYSLEEYIKNNNAESLEDLMQKQKEYRDEENRLRKEFMEVKLFEINQMRYEKGIAPIQMNDLKGKLQVNEDEFAKWVENRNKKD